VVFSLLQALDRFRDLGFSFSVKPTVVNDKAISGVCLFGFDDLQSTDAILVVLPLSRCIESLRSRSQALSSERKPAAVVLWNITQSSGSEELFDLYRQSDIPFILLPSNFPIEQIYLTLKAIDLQMVIVMLSHYLSKALIWHLGIRDILLILHAWTGIETAFRDVRTNHVFVSDDTSQFSEHAKTYPLKELLRLYWHQSIDDGSKVVGYLMLNVPPDIDVNKSSLHSIYVAKEWLSAYQYTEWLLREPQKAIQRNLLRELLKGVSVDKHSMRERLSDASLDADWRVAIIAMSSDPTAEHNQSEVLSILESRLRAFCDECFLLDELGLNIFICLFKKDIEERAVLHNLMQTVQGFFDSAKLSKASAGIGGLGRPLLEVYDTFREAARSLRVAVSERADSKILYWGNLGVDQIISIVAESIEAAQYSKNLLEPLFAFDCEHGTELAQTLLTLEDNAWNINKTALTLSIHYNTVKYRMEKALELLNIDRENPKEQFALSLAIRMYRFGLRGY